MTKSIITHRGCGCGLIHPDTWKFCARTGMRLDSLVMEHRMPQMVRTPKQYCPQCEEARKTLKEGITLGGDAVKGEAPRFCTKCGTALILNPDSPN